MKQINSLKSLFVLKDVYIWMMTMSNQNFYLKEVRESQKVFSVLVIAMEKSHKAVIAGIEERQREEEKRVETLVKELKQEIQELRKETTESDPQIPENGDQSDDIKQTDLVSTLLQTTWWWWGWSTEPGNHQWNTFFMSCRALFPHCALLRWRTGPKLL